MYRVNTRVMRHPDDDLTCAWQVEPSRIRTAADAACLIGRGLAHASVECLRLAHLDAAGALITIDEQQGDRASLQIAFPEIVRTLCLRNTRQLLIAHNHPSGDPTPSKGDRIATRRLADLLRTLDVVLLDHLVFAHGGIASFRALGLI